MAGDELEALADLEAREPPARQAVERARRRPVERKVLSAVLRPVIDVLDEEPPLAEWDRLPLDHQFAERDEVFDLSYGQGSGLGRGREDRRDRRRRPAAGRTPD